MQIEELRIIKGRGRLSLIERQRYQDLWVESGLSKRAFCRQENLCLPTFLTWINKKKHLSVSESGSDGFIPVVLTADTSAHSNLEKIIKFHLPQGLIIEGSFRKEELALWLKEVSHGASALVIKFGYLKKLLILGEENRDF